MRTGAAGSADASFTAPRLSGRSSTARAENPSAKGALNGGRYGPAASGPAWNSIWMSGAGALASVFRNATTPDGRSVAKPVPSVQALASASARRSMRMFCANGPGVRRRYGIAAQT